MKVALIARSTLYEVPGGDTVQVVQTARQLVQLGVDAEILLSDACINYDQYNLLHFFNITRPADILYHSKKAKKPFVVSTILCNYAGYDKHHRKGIAALFRYLPADTIEYLKTMARWVLGRDHLSSLDYLWMGQRKSIMEILQQAKMILPNSESEYRRLLQAYSSKTEHLIVANGVDPELFQYDPELKKDEMLVLCAARTEGIKNQLNLIMALNNTRFRLVIVGAHAPNQAGYYQECRKIAADNVSFIDHIPQEELMAYYQKAKVHILPSWFETTGLSSLEAATMGCNIVITDKGDTREYFGNDAFYCDPASPGSILSAVEKASSAPLSEKLRKKILTNYTWKQAAAQTMKAYCAVTGINPRTPGISIINRGTKLKVAILGTRGIPNHYGGFEHISEYVSEGLVKRGHAVCVYNSHNHSYKENQWNGVEIIHCYDPEYMVGSAGQFVYDLNCLMDARKRKFDVVLMMGYTSSSIWGKLYPAKSTIITNMDGLEWKRSKYSKNVQQFLRYAEKLAVKYSEFYISDSLVIKSYLGDKYNINSKYIPYGADLFSEEEREQVDNSDAFKEDYFLLMARMEPENNIETILEGFNNSNSQRKFKVLGDTGNRFGKFITHKFKNDERIEFKGSIFDTGKVRALQNNSYLYFHGHSVGGTNPSLLEAMASEALIAAHNNPFNKSVLNTDAFYFSNANEVRNIVETVQRKETEKVMVRNNLHKIKYQFNWEKIIDQYEEFIIECHHNSNHDRVISNKG